MKFLTYSEMVALPDKGWLIDGLIMERSSALLFGKSNSFKSFLAIDIACSIATSQTDTERGEYSEWHGRKVMPPCRVLYIATEGSHGVAKQRIPGWMEAHGIPEHQRKNIYLYQHEIALDEDDIADAVIQACRDVIEEEEGVSDGGVLGKFGLIVIDVQGSSMKGSEISDETARAWVANINRIQREVGCATLTVAHSGWGDAKRLRGHSHFWASFDTRIIAEGDKESRTTLLTVDRHKDADSMGQWGFKLETTPTGFGKTTLYPVLSGQAKKVQAAKVSGQKQTALQALTQAIKEHGRTLDGPEYPDEPVVSSKRWRETCDANSLSSGEGDARKRAFNRAKKNLLDKELVGCSGDYFWPIDPLADDRDK